MIIMTKKTKRTYEEMYGEKRAKEIRSKLHYSHLGQKSNKKDKTWEEIYGVENAQEMKKNNNGFFKKGQKFLANGKRMGVKKGNTPWNKDIKTGNMLEKTKIKISNTWTKKVANGYETTNTRNYKQGKYNSKFNGNVMYRSGYELEVMKYFDLNNIEWIYEGKENRFFISKINKYYVNDFYLPKETNTSK